MQFLNIFSLKRPIIFQNFCIMWLTRTVQSKNFPRCIMKNIPCFDHLKSVYVFQPQYLVVQGSRDQVLKRGSQYRSQKSTLFVEKRDKFVVVCLNLGVKDTPDHHVILYSYAQESKSSNLSQIIETLSYKNEETQEHKVLLLIFCCFNLFRSNLCNQ